MYKRICICFLALVVSNLAISQNIKKNWIKVLKGCSASEIFGKETIFFGPSNTIGLGSIWRKNANKGYNPRFELSELVPDESSRKLIIKLGEKSGECVASKNLAWTSKIDLPFIGKIFGLTGVSAELRKARRTTITVENLALDVIKEVPFEQAVRELAKKDSQNIFLNDILSNPGRLLITKAYRLTGLVVKLDYDPKLLEELKTKYPDKASINIGGEKGLNVEFNYSSATELTLKLPNDVYIAGEFSRITEKGTINLEDPSTIRLELTPVKVDPEGTAGKIEKPGKGK